VNTKLALIVSMMIAPAGVHADGGTVQLREESGPFLVTVFTAPETLRVGPIDMSVLVQDRETGVVILDAAVNLELHPIASTSPPFSSRATRGQAKNKLLQAATVDVTAPGWWVVKLFVRRDREEVVLALKLLILPAAPQVAAFWPFLILPPFAIGLFALHQTIKHSNVSKTTSWIANKKL
jgi:hypothetical protein